MRSQEVFTAFLAPKKYRLPKFYFCVGPGVASRGISLHPASRAYVEGKRNRGVQPYAERARRRSPATSATAIIRVSYRVAEGRRSPELFFSVVWTSGLVVPSNRTPRRNAPDVSFYLTHTLQGTDTWDKRAGLIGIAAHGSGFTLSQYTRSKRSIFRGELI